ncbi:PqqD family protein [Latilactobacillus curvatus]|uniref:PqqD family protein n=1 Tax=Latilactobacillus curvatus TaxID=28038 RepID=UPI0011DC7D02|nr:PqqD family protein [Latilactobacillus curvatus]
MGRQKAEIDLEQLIYEKNPQVQFKLQAGQVIIIWPQNHWIQRTLRRLHVKIPLETQLELDDYGSFVFRHVNGKRSVHQIGQALAGQYDEAGEYLYERLLVYLNHLEHTEHLIRRVTD